MHSLSSMDTNAFGGEGPVQISPVPGEQESPNIFYPTAHVASHLFVFRHRRHAPTQPNREPGTAVTRSSKPSCVSQTDQYRSVTSLNAYFEGLTIRGTQSLCPGRHTAHATDSSISDDLSTPSAPHRVHQDWHRSRSPGRSSRCAPKRGSLNGGRRDGCAFCGLAKSAHATFAYRWSGFVPVRHPYLPR
jgi:hypothetical protein